MLNLSIHAEKLPSLFIFRLKPSIAFASVILVDTQDADCQHLGRVLGRTLDDQPKAWLSET